MSRPTRSASELAAMTLPAFKGHLGDLSIEEMTPAERGELVHRMGQHLRNVADDVLRLLDENAALRAELGRERAAPPPAVATLNLALDLTESAMRKVVERDEGRIVAVVPQPA